MQIVSPMETNCMKFENLFSEKNKKKITNLLSAEFAQRVVKVKQSGILWLINQKFALKPQWLNLFIHSTVKTIFVLCHACFSSFFFVFVYLFIFLF